MNHSFNIDYAELYGIEEAIILENIAFWIKKNETNNKNFYDGYTWTYNSAESFNKLFPYITPSKIRRCLLKLEELEVLKSGNYNKANYDKTKWYTITNIEVSTFYKLKNGYYKMENGFYNLENRCEQIVEPIPDINTNINTVINTNKKDTLNISFDEFWKNYKKKIEKQKCLEKWNKLKDIDRDLIIKHIPVYEKSLSDIKYLKNPMTYLNSKMWLDDFEEIKVKKDNSLKTKEDDWSKTTWI